MAAQSNRGGGTWSRYMRQMAFRLGWQSYQGGLPFDYEYARRMYPGTEVSETTIRVVQQLYEAGRLMAAETGKPLPPVARSQTKAINAVVKAAPAMCQLFRTSNALAIEETKRARSLQMRLLALERKKKAASCAAR